MYWTKLKYNYIHTMSVFSCILRTWELRWFAAWDIDAVTEVGNTIEFTCWTVAATDVAKDADAEVELLVTS